MALLKFKWRYYYSKVLAFFKTPSLDNLKGKGVEFLHLKIFNSILNFASLTILVTALFHFLSPFHQTGINNIAIAIFLLIPKMLLNRGYFWWAISIFQISISLALYFFTLLSGREIGIHWLFIITISFPFIMGINFKTFTLSVFSIFFSALLYFTHFNNFLGLKLAESAWNEESSFFAVALCLIAIIVILQQHYQRAIKELKFNQQVIDKNEILMEISREIDHLLVNSDATENVETLIKSGLEVICKKMNWDYALFWRFSATDQVLKPYVSYLHNSDNSEFNEFEKVSRNLTFANGVGLPGRIFESKKMHFIDSLRDDPNFPRASIYPLTSLNKAFGFPVIVETIFYGSIEFYSQNTFDRSSNFEDTFLSIGIRLGQILQRQTNRMQFIETSKMSSLGEMASGIAHEVNNPLTIIKGNAALLQKLIQQGNDDKKEDLLKCVTKINFTADRIGKIVKGLRTFSRDSDNDSMESQNVEKIIEDTLSLCEERFRKHSVQLEVRCPESCFVLGRNSQISQILLNLLNNSFDSVSSLAENWVKLEVKSLENIIEISVTDSGTGIRAEIANKIMQPFFTTKAVGKGTGLGLSISKGIAENHNGTLMYDASSAHTRFVLTLPKALPNSLRK